MSTQQNFHMQHRYSRILRGVLSLINRAIIQPIARWNERRATIMALSSLDDRMLADIGLTRGEIAQLANGRIPRGGSTCSSSSASKPIPPPVGPVDEMRRAA